jgi:hypothetical protein
VPAQEGLRVEGLRDLQRAFGRVDKGLARDLKRVLREAAEPVRTDAEQLATANIPRIGIPWSRMRVGVTQRAVYLAPRQRGAASRRNARLRRPNLANLLLDRAMTPALDRNVGWVEESVGSLLDEVGKDWERG